MRRPPARAEFPYNGRRSLSRRSRDTHFSMKRGNGDKGDDRDISYSGEKAGSSSRPFHGRDIHHLSASPCLRSRIQSRMQLSFCRPASRGRTAPSRLCASSDRRRHSIPATPGNRNRLPTPIGEWKLPSADPGGLFHPSRKCFPSSRSSSARLSTAEGPPPPRGAFSCEGRRCGPPCG